MCCYVECCSERDTERVPPGDYKFCRVSTRWARTEGSAKAYLAQRQVILDATAPLTASASATAMTFALSCLTLITKFCYYSCSLQLHTHTYTHIHAHINAHHIDTRIYTHAHTAIFPRSPCFLERRLRFKTSYTLRNA
jgi:hypothetical protein